MPLTAAYSSSGAPSVDRTAAERILSQRLLNNVVQAQMHTDGKGLYERVTDRGDILEVRVLKHEGITATSRTIGAGGTTGNTKYFNELGPEQPSHSSEILRLNEVFDRPQVIPQLMQDVIGIDILNNHGTVVEQRIRQLINAYTIAKQVQAALNYSVTENTTTNIIEYDSATEAMTDKFFDASIQLNDGDPDNFIDAFSSEGRIGIFRTAGQRAFFQEDKNIFAVGSSRAVELLEIGSTGTLNREAVSPDVTGWFGELNKTPLHMAATTIWNLVQDYLGGADISGVLGLVAAAEGTGRGYGVGRVTKLVDTRGGQGIEMQPLVRWGVEVWYPKSIALIVTAGFVNPAGTTATPTLLDVLGTEQVV